MAFIRMPPPVRRWGRNRLYAQLVERLKTAVLKTAGGNVRGFKSYTVRQVIPIGHRITSFQWGGTSGMACDKPVRMDPHGGPFTL